ncbi:MAG: SAV_6107 family HEPN domain-containing protein [Actinomycetota bacterium]|nr:SAV_6107 family HEPN domain-containing protein [Actinomycetota bacterium]
MLAAAAHGLTEASLTSSAADRFASAHRAALRAAAAVVAVRTSPDGRRRPPRSVWALLPAVAPELTEWAAYFAAGAGKRAAAEAGLTRAVSDREADDLVRDAETFLTLIHTTLGVPDQPTLPRSGRLIPCAG